MYLNVLLGKIIRAIQCVLILVVLVEEINAQTWCNYYGEVPVGNMQYVYSPGYPQNYNGQQFDWKCRWLAECPPGYNCNLRCNIEMPFSEACSQDHLLIARDGDPTFNGANSYCGLKQVELRSVDNRIAVGLIVKTAQPGGRFVCNLTAVPRISCNCGIKNYRTRVIGGHETKVNEYPMMVGIGDLRIVKVYAGGVIISDSYVLTAAHVINNINRKDIIVVVGEHDLSTGFETNGTRVYYVRSMKPHEMFGKGSTEWDYDIAVIRTTSKIVFNQLVGPACLPFSPLGDLDGNKVTVLGWGTTFPGGPTSNVLQEAVIDVISLNTCKQYLSGANDRTLCTKTPGKDLCQGDSGGPILYEDPLTGREFLVGIASWGYGCDTAVPGVNTKVESYLNWILTNTPAATYCTI